MKYCATALLRQVVMLLALSSLRAGADEPVVGQVRAWSSLLDHSPFGRNPPAAGPESDASLEYRGFYVEEGIHYFCLYERSKKLSYWLRPHETKHQTTIRRYDEATGTVYAEHAGKMVAMPLRQARVALTAMPETDKTSSDSVAAGGGGVSQEEVGRLQQVADEIRRRRALRQAGKSTDVARIEQSP